MSDYRIPVYEGDVQVGWLSPMEKPPEIKFQAQGQMVIAAEIELNKDGSITVLVAQDEYTSEFESFIDQKNFGVPEDPKVQKALRDWFDQVTG